MPPLNPEDLSQIDGADPESLTRLTRQRDAMVVADRVRHDAEAPAADDGARPEA